MTRTIFVLSLILATPVLADDQSPPQQPPSDVGGFITWCNQNADACSGMIKQHQDLMLVMSTLGGKRKFCVPPSVSAEERRVAVIEWVGTHADDKSAPVGDKLELAEQSIWPCHH